MSIRGHAARVAWPLIDQGIASLGTFALTIILARSLPLQEYGIFALLLGVLMVLHMVTSSLLFYPMSLNGSIGTESAGVALLRTIFVLLSGVCLAAAGVLALACISVDRVDLIGPVVIYFLCWQAQEACRRYLFTKLRFAAAVPGDVISYLGQVGVLLLLAYDGRMSVAGAFYAMALTSGIAALIQAWQAGLFARPEERSGTAAIIRDCWSLGSWSLANNLLSISRVQILFWVMAALGGATLPAFLQAGLNVVNLMNPVVIGLCNIIPQTAARAHGEGKAQAWRATRPIVLSGVPVAILFFVIVIAAPGTVLGLIYGSTSPYVSLTWPVQILALTAIASYATDMVCSYFHGVAAARLALIVNAVGAATTVIAGAPLIVAYGLSGGCMALGLASIARLCVSQFLFNRLIAGDTTGDLKAAQAEKL